MTTEQSIGTAILLGPDTHRKESATMTAIHAYKMLIQDIAERLGPEDINSITFQESLPDSAKSFSSLSLLRQLEREGLFSPSNIQPLADLLRRIHRHDLVNNYVEVYLSHLDKYRSLPTQSSPQVMTNSRSRSLPSHSRAGVNLQQEGSDHTSSSQSTTEVDTQHSLTHEPYSYPQIASHSLQNQPFSDSMLYSPEGVQTQSTRRPPFNTSRTPPRTSTPTFPYLGNEQSPTFCHTRVPLLYDNKQGHSTPRSMSVSSSDILDSPYHLSSLNSSQELLDDCPSQPEAWYQTSGHRRFRKGHSLDSSFRNHTQHCCLPEQGRSLSPQTLVHVTSSSLEQLPHHHQLAIINRLKADHLPTDRSSLAMGLKRRASENILIPGPEARIPRHPLSFSPSSYSAPGSNRTLPRDDDSGLEMLPHVLSQMSISSIGDSIQPWMSVSNEHLRVPRSTKTEDDTVTPRTSLHSKGSEGTDNGPEHHSVGREKQRPCSPQKKLIRLPRRCSKSSSQELKWLLKRNDLNKAIYKHKENKCFTSSDKLELDVGCGKANPKLVFKLYPYGLEQDRGKNTTLEVEIELPKKCTRLPSSAMLKLRVTALDCKEAQNITSHRVEKSMELRCFIILGFVTHDDLKNSHSDLIEVQASADVTGVTKTLFASL